MTALHAHRIDALRGSATGADDGHVTLQAPHPGWFVPSVTAGSVVMAGDVLGELEVLGRKTTVRVPIGAHGTVVAMPSGGSRIAVAFKATLCTLDSAMVLGSAGATTTTTAAHADGLVFRAPSSGRFYGRPAPGKPAFVEVGAQIRPGQTVCMLEVMKTFHRVSYTGGSGGLPTEATVIELLVADEADVNVGDPLMRLEPVA